MNIVLKSFLQAIGCILLYVLAMCFIAGFIYLLIWIFSNIYRAGAFSGIGLFCMFFYDALKDNLNNTKQND